MKKLLTLFSTLTLMLVAITSHATILTTVNNGNYNDPNHWDQGFAPGPADTAIIVHETYNVGIASIKRIEIYSLFTGSNPSMLTITGAGVWSTGSSCSVNITSEGDFWVLGNVGRQMQANFTNNGTLYWSEGSVGFVQKTFTNNGTFYATSSGGSFGEVLGCTFVNNGLISVGSSGTVSLTPSIFTNNADIAVNNGTLGISGTMTNFDTIIISTGATMVVNAFNTLVLESGSGLLGGGTLQVKGNLVTNIVQDVYPQFFLDGGNLQNTGTGSLNLLNDAIWTNGFIQRPVTLAATKTMTVSQTSSMALSSTLTNNGTINWQSGGAQWNNGYLVNNGIVNVNGNVNFSAVGPALFTNNGTINHMQSGTATMSVTFENNGTLNLNNGVGLYAATSTNTGIINIAAGARLDNQGTLLLNAGTQLNGAGTLHTYNVLTINTAVIANCAIHLDGGAFGNITGTGSISINNSMLWNSGFVQRPTTINPGKTLTININNSAGLNALLNNQGNATWSAGSIQFSDGTLDNDGIFNFTGNISPSGLGGVTLFRNDGTMNFNQPGTISVGMNAVNTGTIQINSGDLAFAGNLANSGIINTAANKYVYLNGSSTFEAGTQLNGNGTIRNNNNMTVNTAVVMHPFFECFGGNNSGTGSVIIDNLMTWIAGNISYLLIVNPGKTLNINTGNSKSLINTTLNNQGILNYMDGGWSLQTSAIVDNDGTMNILGDKITVGGSSNTLLRNDGTLNFDHTGFSNISTAMMNNGVINVNNGTSSNAAENFTNNGTIDIDAGKLFQLNATSNFASSSVLTGSGTLRNNNNMNLLSGAVTTDCPFEMQGFNINGPGSLTVNNSMNWVFGSINANLTINPGKMLTLSTGNGKSLNNATMDNQGTLVYNGGGWSLQGTAIVDNNGTMNIEGDNITVGGNATTLLNNDGILNFNHTGFSNINTAMTNNGIINVNSGSTSNAANNFTNYGTIDIDAGKSFQLNSNSYFYSTSVLTGVGLLRNNNNMNLTNGNVTTDCPFEMQGFNIFGPGSLTVNNAMNWISSNISANTTINIGKTLTVSTGNGKSLSGATLNNLGTIIYNGGGWSLQSNAILENDGIMGFQGSNIDLGGNSNTLLRNDGILNFDQTGFSNIQTALTNNGTINFNNGTTTNINQNFTNSGTMDIDATRLVQLNSNTNFNAASILTGAGTLRNNNNMNLLSGNITTDCPFEMQGFNINGPGSLVINNSMLWVFGTINANTTINSGKTLIVSTSNGKTLNNATLANLGTLIYDGGGWGLQGNAILNNQGTMRNSNSNSLGGNNSTFLQNNGFYINDHLGASSLNTAFSNNANGVVKGLGTLNFNSNLTNTGTVAPGLSPGVLTLSKLTSNILEIEIAGTSGGGNAMGHDSLRVNSATTLTGTLAVKFINGYAPVPGDHFTFLTSPATISGSFSTISFDPALPSYLTGDLTYGNNIVTLTINGNCPIYYADADNDGFGDLSSSIESCVPPSGYVDNADDCDDTNADINPNAMEICNLVDDDCDMLIDEGVQSTFYADTDGDSFGDANNTTLACDLPSGFVTNADDCNDTNANISPAATEICNLIDDDCDSQIDEGVQFTFYADADNDGFGDASQTTLACDVPTGYTTNGDDCNDMDGNVNPSAIEICNGIDDNCDGQIDESVQSTFYLDLDGDGFGDASHTTMACSVPSGYSANADDCDDTNLNINPSATEVCNGIDDNCNGQIDEGVQTTFYADADGDGFGDLNSTILACTSPSGYVENADDCDDTNFEINPSAMEVCNGIDENCNGQIDEGVQSTFYADADGDSFGDSNSMTIACTAPSGYVENADDCDDTNFNINPNATEVCNGVDDNCDGQIDETDLAVNLTAGTIACAGGTTTLTANGTSGFPPYQYSLNGGAFSNQNTFTVSAGTHSVEVKDAHNCVSSNSVTVTEPLPLTIPSVDVTHVSCNGGSTGAVNITVAGGTTPYGFNWSNGKHTEDIQFLVAGAYSVTVLDSHGCSTPEQAVVNPKLKLVTSKTNVNCFGGNDGTATATVTGGLPPYSVVWSNGQMTPTITNLAAGTYSVTVLDAANCMRTGSVAISQPAQIAVSGTRTNVSCNGFNDGEIDLSVANGASPMSFAWSDGPTTEDRSDIFAGTYTVTVTDALGCTNTKSFTITEPTALTLSLAVVNVTCNGTATGKITATIGGGTKFPTTSLCNNERYCIEWSNGATSRINDQLVAGTYDVTVTDMNGCVVFGSATVTEPAVLDILDVQQLPLTNGKYKLTVIAAGGTTPYKYLRIPGSTSYQTSNIFNNVPVGDYQIVVRDNKLCTDTVEISVPFESGTNLLAPDGSDWETNAESLEIEIEAPNKDGVALDMLSKSVNDFRLYPNPANEEVNVLIHNDFSEGEMYVFDLQGRLVSHQKLGGDKSVSMKLNEMQNGLYFIKLQLDNELITKRLVVEH